MTYIGEHIIPGFLGNSFIFLALISLVLSVFFYQSNIRNSLKLGRLFYSIHFVSLISSIVILFYIIYNHYFEYKYVWQYSSRDLPVKYIISCFWAGQEGGFLIWAFWQALLGIILIKTSKEWESKTVSIVAVSQFFMLTMLLGWEISGIKIGSNPFVLLRDTIFDKAGSIFADPNYLTMLGDGNGLNPLLENIWMVTHPPILFLGFASALIPFSYAVSALLRNDLESWIIPAKKWVVFSIFTLGIGLILGGRWAYESLTFGGFWAWDPVENSSLVPWMILVATLHFMLIYKRIKYALLLSFVFSFLGFAFVLYSSFLTRSGVLGNSSAHAFNGDGTSLQLLIYLLSFLVIPFILFILKYKAPKFNFTESVMNKDFWMMIGALIILLSAFHIILTTSIPVLSGFTGLDIAPPIDRVGYYNKWQIPFAAFISILIGFSLSFNRNENNVKKIIINLLMVVSISVIASLIIDKTIGIATLNLTFLVFAAFYSVFNILIGFFLKDKNIFALICHLGVVVFLLGTVLTFSNSTIISINNSSGNELNYPETITLRKNEIIKMGDYFVSYKKTNTLNAETYYHIDFYNDTTSQTKLFSISPSVNRNKNMGFVYNPDTRHLWDKDIFTYIVYVEDEHDYQILGEGEIRLYDSLQLKDAKIIFAKLTVCQPEKDTMADNVEIIAELIMKKNNEKIDTSQIHYIVKENKLSKIDGLFFNGDYKVVFKNLSKKAKTISIEILRKSNNSVVVKTIIFPYINVMWAGVALLFIGLILIILKKIVVRNRKKLK